MSYVHDDVDPEVGHVPDDGRLLGRDLGVLDQLGQVLLGNAILGLDVQQDDPGKQRGFNLKTFKKSLFQPDLILDGDVLVQQHRDNVPHVVPNLLALRVGPHGQILFNLGAKIKTFSKISQKCI